MKNILSVSFRLARPEAYPGKGDKFLPKIIQDLANLQRKTQKDFHYDTLRLSANKIRDIFIENDSQLFLLFTQNNGQRYDRRRL